ncbi:hypothetical protein ACFWJ5_07810 [Streptomyces qaidamensis]|uniref:HD domain-containing protein n=1 Tax=Streptomyces qaidamensis TaxID=1783515 RepID=UPI00365F8D34
MSPATSWAATRWRARSSRPVRSGHCTCTRPSRPRGPRPRPSPWTPGSAGPATPASGGTCRRAGTPATTGGTSPPSRAGWPACGTKDRSPEQDPWCDSRIATAFPDNVEWLLGEPPGDGTKGLDLYPAEASLLVLFPFLHRVHYLRRAVRLAQVRPWSLRPAGTADPDRQGFEVFAEESEALVRRALRDPGAEPLVGWWLCHRRLAQHGEFSDSDSVHTLMAELGDCAVEPGAALAADRVTVLLHGLRRGPDVCHPEFLNLLPADDRVRCGPGHQQIRFQRVGLLVALAYGMSVETTALPDIVAEHLAIPYPVDLPLLHRTLAEAHWGGSRDLPVLRAECHHEAVVEGLREYTARADAMLHAIRRTVRERVNQPMPDLPTRLSADGVVPSRGTFDGYARFRSDGRRVLDLAMGIELYKDRDLAVRELYQNALDACRYRRARQEYLDRTTEPSGTPYTGSISAEQLEFKLERPAGSPWTRR